MIGVVPVRIQLQFYSPEASFIASQFYCASHSVIRFASFKANKITLNPQDSIALLSGDNNITLQLGRIPLKLTENEMRTYSPQKA